MFTPDWTVSPGEILVEYLECLGWTVPAFSIETGLAEATIHSIIDEKSPITPEIALGLGRIIHSDRFWLNLERQYRSDLDRFASKEGGAGSGGTIQTPILPC